jgi:hypothetical protein
MIQNYEPKIQISKSARQVPILVAIVTAVAIAVIYFLIWSPAKTDAEETAVRVDTLNRQVQRQQETLTSYREDSSSYQELSDAVNAADAKIPYIAANSREEAIRELQIDIPTVVQTAADAAGVDMVVSAYTLKTYEGTLPSVGAIGTSITMAEASFGDLDAFIAELEAVGQLPTVQQVIITPAAIVSDSDAPASNGASINFDGPSQMNAELNLWFSIEDSKTSTADDSPGSDTAGPGSDPLVPLSPLPGGDLSGL